MTNDEIGTYQIAEAVRAQPKLRVILSGGGVQAKINGEIYRGNFGVLKNSIDCSKIKVLKTLKDNKVDFKQDSIEILNSTYGVEYDRDWELIFNPEEVWNKSQLKSTKTQLKTKSVFGLDEDDGTSIM